MQLPRIRHSRVIHSILVLFGITVPISILEEVIEDVGSEHLEQIEELLRSGKHGRA